MTANVSFDDLLHLSYLWVSGIIPLNYCQCVFWWFISPVIPVSVRHHTSQWLPMCLLMIYFTCHTCECQASYLSTTANVSFDDIFHLSYLWVSGIIPLNDCQCVFWWFISPVIPVSVRHHTSQWLPMCLLMIYFTCDTCECQASYLSTTANVSFEDLFHLWYLWVSSIIPLNDCQCVFWWFISPVIPVSVRHHTSQQLPICLLMIYFTCHTCECQASYLSMTANLSFDDLFHLSYLWVSGIIPLNDCQSVFDLGSLKPNVMLRSRQCFLYQAEETAVFLSHLQTQQSPTICHHRYSSTFVRWRLRTLMATCHIQCTCSTLSQKSKTVVSRMFGVRSTTKFSKFFI